MFVWLAAILLVFQHPGSLSRYFDLRDAKKNCFCPITTFDRTEYRSAKLIGHSVLSLAKLWGIAVLSKKFIERKMPAKTL